MALGLGQNAVLSKKGVHFFKDAWENGVRVGTQGRVVKGGTLSLAQKWPDFKRSRTVTGRGPEGQGPRGPKAGSSKGGPLVWPKGGQISKGACM